MHGVKAFPENTKIAASGWTAAAVAILPSQSHVAVPPNVLFDTV